MNIFLRILTTFIACIWRAKIAPTETLHGDFIVGPTEADLRYVGNARYLLFMEVHRLELMLRTGIFFASRKYGWVPLVVSQTIRYKRPLRRFQRFTLKTTLVGWDDRWLFLEHKFERNGAVIAFAMVKSCFRGPDGVVPPREAFHVLGFAGDPKPLARHFSDWTTAEALQEAAF